MIDHRDLKPIFLFYVLQQYPMLSEIYASYYLQKTYDDLKLNWLDIIRIVHWSNTINSYE